MRRSVFGTAFGIAALTAAVTAQEPYPQQPKPDRPPAQTQPRTQEQGQMATVEGCLMREADVPGRKPNVAERAGIAEDYILTSAKVVKGTPPTGTTQPRPGETPTGTTGAQQAMFEVEGIGEDQLKQHVGQRVQIEGTFENVDRARATPEPGTPADDLVEIRGTTIRKVSGSCPAGK